MKVMNVTTVNTRNCNQKMNEQKPSFKALTVNVFPPAECSKKSLVGIIALIKYSAKNFESSVIGSMLRLGVTDEGESSKLVAVLNTENGSKFEEAINKGFFGGTANVIPDEEAELIETFMPNGKTIFRASPDVLSEAEELVDALSLTDAEKAKALSEVM